VKRHAVTPSVGGERDLAQRSAITGGERFGHLRTAGCPAPSSGTVATGRGTSPCVVSRGARRATASWPTMRRAPVSLHPGRRWSIRPRARARSCAILRTSSRTKPPLTEETGLLGRAKVMTGQLVTCIVSEISRPVTTQ
jgi:hypothetical protein